MLRSTNAALYKTCEILNFHYEPGLNFTRMYNTHCGTAHENDDESPNDTSDSHQPGHPEEQDDSEDVLDARQINAHQCAELGSLKEERGEMRRKRHLSIIHAQLQFKFLQVLNLDCITLKFR